MERRAGGYLNFSAKPVAVHLTRRRKSEVTRPFIDYLYETEILVLETTLQDLMEAMRIFRAGKVIIHRGEFSLPSYEYLQEVKILFA